jgi:hypothetical protein
MSASCGFQTPIDSGLYQIIKSPNTSMHCFKIVLFPNLIIIIKWCLETNPDEEYTISCLMMVLLAVSISRLTRYDSSQYKIDLQGFFLLILNPKMS